MRPDGQRRYPIHIWRRMVAQQESKALRHLVRAYGRLPLYAATRWEW